MNKFLTKIAGVVASLAMVIGVGVGVANKQAKGVYADPVSCEMTGDINVTLKVANNSTGEDVKSGKKMNKGNAGTITVPAAAGSTTLYYHAVAWNGEAQTISLTCTNATLSSSSQAITANSNVSGSGTTYVIGDFSSYLYSVELTQTSVADMVLTLTAASSKRFVIFDAYYNNNGSDQSKISTTTTITVPGNKTTLDLAVTPTDTVQLSANVTPETGSLDSPVVTWTSSKANVATVNPSSGVVTAVAKGTTTITAIYAGDEDYNNSSATVDIDVINSNEVVFDFKTIAAANSWVSGSAYTEVTVDGVTITASGGGNNAKYYSSDDTWRMYNGGSLTITPPSGKSIVSVSSDPSITFVIASAGTSASFTFTNQKNFKSITVELGAEKVLDTITAVITNNSRVWRTNDIVQASDLTVTPHYTDGTDGTPIIDGEGVTVTNGTLLNVGNNVVNVAFGGKSTTVNVNALSSAIVAWELSGEIGDTVKLTPYDLSGLVLRGWYDNGKTDEASDGVINQYELVANPDTAGSVADPDNKIEVKVYLKTDTGHSNCLNTFSNVAAPVIVAAHGTEGNPYTVAEARAAIDELSTISGAYVTGIISKIDSYSSQYKSITYWISDNGTQNNQLKVYSGKGVSGADFNSKDDIELGAVVTITGDLKMYNSDYEFDKNNEIVSYQAPSRNLSSITLSGDYPTEFVTGDTFSHEGAVVTAHYDNGSQTNVTASATFEGYDMSSAGEQTITVSYTEDEVTKTVTYTITVTYVERINYNRYEENTIVEGDYIIYYDGRAMKNSIGSNRAEYEDVSVNYNAISNYLETIVWHIARDGDYYTIYNSAVGKYLASTGSDNQAKLEATVTDNSRWSISSSDGEYEFVNKARDEASSTKKYLRNNGTYGFACYGDNIGGNLSLFKRDSMSYLNSFATEASLLANETNEGVDSVQIKFKTKIAKYAWNELNTNNITEFGMMLNKTRENPHTTAQYDFEHEVDQANPVTVLPINNTDFGLTLDDEGEYYSFTVKINISGPSSYDIMFCAAPYVVINGTYHFLDNLDPSVNYLAQNGLIESSLSAEAIAILAGE